MENQINPINKLKILSCYKEIKQAIKGNIPVPRTAEFFVSDSCNHKCKGCHSSMLHKMKKPFLDIKKSKQILNELSHMGVESIEISGGGESLLHPHILEFIEHCYKCNFEVGLITNGSLITKKMLPTLNKLLFIRIAMDAATLKTYKKVHGVGDFFKIIENTKMVVDYKKKHHGKVTIGLKYLVSQFNDHEILEATNIAKKLNVDYIQFKPLRNSSNALKMINHIKSPLIQSKKLATDDFQVLGGFGKSSISKRCILNILHPVIDASGKVYLCAFWQFRAKTHCIGDIYKQSFKEIWYGERHREAYLNTDYNQCNIFDCPFHSANYIVEEAIIKDKMHLEFI